jgi:hypothetical protein
MLRAGVGGPETVAAGSRAMCNQHETIRLVPSRYQQSQSTSKAPHLCEHSDIAPPRAAASLYCQPGVLDLMHVMSHFQSGDECGLSVALKYHAAINECSSLLTTRRVRAATSIPTLFGERWQLP